MAKPELGIKRTCLSCSAKFYDLNKEDILCPSCGAEFDPESAMKLKRGRTAPANDDKPAKETKKKETATDEDSDDLDVDLDDDDEDVLEDTSDLDDDDEVPGVGGGDDDDDDS